MPARAQLNFSFSETLQARDLPLNEATLRKVLSEILKLLKAEKRVQGAQKKLGCAFSRLGVYLCTDKEMREYQKSFRRLDRSTDVLSFPTVEIPEEELSRLPKSELSLGDLILSLPASARGAQRGRRSVEEEFLEVFVHGILHLLGDDHVLKSRGVSLKEAQLMRKLQKQLFLKLRADIKLPHVRKSLAKKP